jgi:hypothetical protein
MLKRCNDKFGKRMDLVDTTSTPIMGSNEMNNPPMALNST